MANLSDHPIAQRIKNAGAPASRPTLTAESLKALVMECGADDCGVVSLSEPSMEDERPYILAAFPGAKTVVSVIRRMHLQPVRSPQRSVSNSEFHAAGHDVEDVVRAAVRRLEDMGIGAMNPSTAFPMEMGKFPERGWIVSQKILAEAAGMGKRGLHRSIIHPKFGSFVLLGAIIIDQELAAPESLLDYNPCFECKLCVAACPVGAIKNDGHFDFSSCFNHNYQQFMGGFVNFVEDIVESKSAEQFETKNSFSETVERWQSLTFGANYNSAYCIAVCPAGEDLMGRYLGNMKQHVEEVVKPLQAKDEPIFVVRNSDAEEHLLKKFPHKRPRYVRSSARLPTIKSFIEQMYLGFNRGKAAGVDCVYHFIFTGAEVDEATVIIRDKTLTVERGLHGKPNMTVRADSATWLRFLAGRVSIARALITRKIIMKGKPSMLIAFGKCFPR